ncbi:hypothetical protein OSB35_23020 [Burkholderia pseudomallei]|uniref:hypothetical protein n=1 Tax=Burkholderia pseudomallei TaxID=28450 RepID=UPI00225BAB45|nr:hypothetical protein [Burkholderia pseudomallei]UZU21978.1 hypothetical protein OSB35_23020 [Burkholderia pseudomallei]
MKDTKTRAEDLQDTVGLKKKTERFFLGGRRCLQLRREMQPACRGEAQSSRLWLRKPAMAVAEARGVGLHVQRKRLHFRGHTAEDFLSRGAMKPGKVIS